MWLTPGSVFASAGALLATFLFGFYVSRFAGYNATYGALGAVVSFLMWLYVAAFVLLLGAELNAEIEHQTARDTTIGGDVRAGERGAVMADTIAAPPFVPDAEPTEQQPKIRDSAWKPVAAGVLASRISRHAGTVPVGVIPMTLIANGLALLGQRKRTGLALFCLGTGALAAWRARSGTGVEEV